MSKKKKFIITLIVISIIALNVVYYTNVISPAVKADSLLTVESEVRNAVNRANEVILKKNVTYESLFAVNKNDDGEVCLITANNGLIDQISMLWGTEIQNNLNRLQTVRVTKPMGAYTGNAVLSKFGRNVTLEYHYNATSRTDYYSVFIEKGINQTLHRLYLVAYVDVKVLTPAIKETSVITDTFLFSETIINGKVPSTYISSAQSTDYLDLLE